MEEIWKHFKELKRTNLYVSSYVRVKSIDLQGTEKILSLYGRGGKRKQYLSFGYKEKNKKILVQIHQAVAELFLPPKPGEEYVIDHIDDNSFNNVYTNLQWLTSSKNGTKGNYFRWNKFESHRGGSSPPPTAKFNF